MKYENITEGILQGECVRNLIKKLRIILTTYI